MPMPCIAPDFAFDAGLQAADTTSLRAHHKLSILVRTGNHYTHTMGNSSSSSNQPVAARSDDALTFQVQYNRCVV